ncbi:hypothetical protein XnspCFBP7698_12780 [Xanthomonas sp. CFBP 7698]|nr:hypothetical protein XnspCFBP7698_12780 [Xanthomonas sp. CFBP 7698]
MRRRGMRFSAGIRDSGFGNRDSGFGNRESGIGNRESGKACAAIGSVACVLVIMVLQLTPGGERRKCGSLCCVLYRAAAACADHCAMVMPLHLLA